MNLLEEMTQLGVRAKEASRALARLTTEEKNRCLLAMGGFGDTHLTSMQWPELLPSDPLQERQYLLLDDQMGIASKETISQHLGYEWETEQKRIAEETTAAAALAQTLTPADDRMLQTEEGKLVPRADTQGSSATTEGTSV